MVDIATISHEASLGLLYDIHHIARSVLRLIGEDHCIAAHDEEAFMLHRPSIRLFTSSTVVRMQPIAAHNVTHPTFGSCAAPRNLLGQPSLCLMIHTNTRRTRHSPQLIFY